MTRGNQRDLARAKNQKKLTGQKGKKEDGLSKEQRMARDAEIMRQKQVKKEKQKTEGGSSSSK